MNNFREKLKAIGGICLETITEELTNENTMMWSAGAGIYQGLKYKGNLIRGIKGTVAVFTALTLVKCARKVVLNKDTIRNI